MNGTQDTSVTQDNLLDNEPTYSSDKFKGFGIIDVIILIVCFIILIIMIVLRSIYCKRRKELLMRKKKKKIATDNTIDKEKAINNKELDKEKGKEPLDLTNVINQNHPDNEDDKINSEKNVKNSQNNSITHYNDNTATNLNTYNLNTNSQLKMEQSNQQSKLLIFNDTPSSSAKSESNGSVVISIAKSNKELLKTEDISSSQRSKKNEKYEKANKVNSSLNDLSNFNDVELSSIKFNVNSKKRGPKEIPKGKFEKKVTKESGILKDFESFKIGSSRNFSQQESAKINTSKEYENSLNSKENRNIIYKNIFEVDNDKIESESEEDEEVEETNRNKSEFHKHGQTLMNTFKKYEDNVLDSLADKEKYLYGDEDINIIRSGTGMDSKNKESNNRDNQNLFRNKLENARLAAQKQKVISDKPVQKKSLQEDPKIDIISLKNKNLFKENNKKQFSIFNFKENKMSSKQHSDFMDD